jgi:hypothetical protein
MPTLPANFQSVSAAQAAMAAAAGWDWVAPAAALATSAAVWALTACWLALCRLAAWRRRRTRVASGFSPPDPPNGSRNAYMAYTAKGGHGGARAGSGSAKRASPLGAQRGLAKRDESKGRSRNPKGRPPMGRPIRIMTVLLLPLSCCPCPAAPVLLSTSVSLSHGKADVMG